MTIGFSTHWPQSMPKEIAGKPNHFVEKIWAGLIHGIKEINISDYETYSLQHWSQLGTDMSDYVGIYIEPKIHTFREDPKDRWKVGMEIHPVINNRTKKRFQFAPTIHCISIQNVEIIYSDEDLCDHYGTYPVIKIDGRVLDMNEMESVAKNDGFDSLYHFCNWFNSDWKGKIIHWTNRQY